MGMASGHRWLVLVHRWSSLVLGLLLVVETTTGAVLLFHGEEFRATHQQVYQHTAGTTQVTAQQAMDIVTVEHPGYTPAWVSTDDGVFAVGDQTYTTAYFVDPGTGHVNGFADLEGGVLGWLANLHDCALTCQDYPGYVAALAQPVFGVTWGALLLGVLGLLMVLLVITGIITWWPRRLSHGFRVRTHRGRFARDHDLHNVIGIVALPFLLMWGVTGASFELPAVQNAWLTITGGDHVDADEYTFAAHQAPIGTPAIGTDSAVRTALDRVPGQVRYVVAASGAAEYYTVSVASGYRPYDHRVLFGGDRTVYVDAHDAAHTKVAEAGQSGSNTFYDRVFEPSHFGWMVDGWWRVLWAAFGLTPLALAVTGLSTWLFRRSARRRRRRAAA
jgi:uncharacterized iron-regulated membrane protein